MPPTKRRAPLARRVCCCRPCNGSNLVLRQAGKARERIRSDVADAHEAAHGLCGGLSSSDDDDFMLDAGAGAGVGGPVVSPSSVNPAPGGADDNPDGGDGLGGGESPFDSTPSPIVRGLTGAAARFEMAMEESLDAWRFFLVSGEDKTALGVILSLLRQQVAGKQTDAEVQRALDGWRAQCPGGRHLPETYANLRRVVLPHAPVEMDVDCCNSCYAAFMDESGQRIDDVSCAACGAQSHFRSTPHGALGFNVLTTCINPPRHRRPDRQP